MDKSRSTGRWHSRCTICGRYVNSSEDTMEILSCVRTDIYLAVRLNRNPLHDRRVRFGGGILDLPEYAAAAVMFRDKECNLMLEINMQKQLKFMKNKSYTYPDEICWKFL